MSKLVKATKDERYAVAILLASEAGFRIGEIRGLQWTDVDFKARMLTIRRQVDTDNNIGPPKNGKLRRVPMSRSLAKALGKLPRRGIWVLTRLADDEEARKGQKRVSAPGGFLGYSVMNTAIKSIYARAKVEITDAIDPWHSLRHSFGTELAASNVPLPTIQRLMGHADVRTTMRYISTNADQMDAAIASTFGR